MKKLTALLLLVVGFNTLKAQIDTLTTTRQVLKEAWKEFEGDNKEKGIQLLESVNSNDTAYSLVQVGLARMLNTAKEYDRCVSVCNKALKNSTEYRNALLNLKGKSLADAGKYSEAREAYRIGLREYPNDHIIRYNYANSFFKEKNYDSCYYHLQQTVKLNPYSGQAHYLLGLLSVYQKQYVKTFLAWTFYLQLNNDEGANTVLTFLETVCKNGDVIKKEEYVKPFTDNKEFESLDQLVKGMVALSDKYKSKVGFDYAVVKQIQFVMEQFKYNPNSTDFYMSFYGKVYNQMLQKKMNEAFLLQCISSVQNDKVRSAIKKNQKDIDALLALEGSVVTEIDQQNKAKIEGKDGAYRIWRSNGTVDAFGNVNADNKRIGYWRFFYDNGRPSAEGEYTTSSEQTGEWKFYYKEGGLKKTVGLKNGVLEGPTKFYNKHGVLVSEHVNKNDKSEGDGMNYYNCGALKETFFYKGGELMSGTYVYKNGQTEADYKYKNGKLDGMIKKFHPNGQLKSETFYTAGQENGDYKEYYITGKKYSAGLAKNGSAIGTWEFFYPSGVLKTKNIFDQNGVQTAHYTYYPNGKPESEQFYKDKAIDGETKFFDDDGKLHYILTYKKGKTIGAKYFDKAGAVLAEGAHKKGNFSIIGYTPDGLKSLEGTYKDGNETGEWKYYNRAGFLFKKITYTDGKQHGPVTVYHENGKIAEEYHNLDGEIHGRYREYFSNGKTEMEGYLINGNQAGEWKEYFPDGTLKFRKYYSQGEVHGHLLEFTAKGNLVSDKEFEEGEKLSETYFDSTGAIVNKIEYLKKATPYVRSYPNGKPLFTGQLTCGEFSGDSKWYYADGTVSSEFKMKSDKKEGLMVTYYDTKSVRNKLNYVNGKREGMAQDYFKNGKLEEIGKYVDDKRDSLWRFYHDNGLLWQAVNYVNGEREGEVINYNPKGEIVNVKYYHNGELVAYSYEKSKGVFAEKIPVKGNETITCYFPNGKISFQETWKNGVLHGVQKLYFSDGKIYIDRTSVDGQFEGASKDYYADGKVKSEGNYFYDELHGLWNFYRADGTKEYSINYAHGEREGYTFHYDNTGKLTKKVLYRADEIYPSK